MRLIEWSCIMERLQEQTEVVTSLGLAAGLLMAQGVVLETPTIDAVEVVRCRDCIHWFPHTQCGFDEDNDEYHDYCGLLIPDDDYYAFRRKSDDYCSYGERREDGEA